MKAIRMILTLSLLISKLAAATFSESGNMPWGCDVDLIHAKREKTAAETPKQSIAQKSCRTMITFFQKYISPIDGPRSSFYPSSSQYTLDAIQKYGVIQGIGLGCDRLLRENGELWVYDTTFAYDRPCKVDPVR